MIWTTSKCVIRSSEISDFPKKKAGQLAISRLVHGCSRPAGAVFPTLASNLSNEMTFGKVALWLHLYLPGSG